MNIPASVSSFSRIFCRTLTLFPTPFRPHQELEGKELLHVVQASQSWGAESREEPVERASGVSKRRYVAFILDPT